MKPSRKPRSGTDDLFRSRLDNIIDMRHELLGLAGAIDWAFFEDAFDAFYSEEGRPGIPMRMMVGIHILKHMFDLSDEEVCERRVENPYFQCFCGEEYFQFELPIDRSSMTRWRDRIGPEGLEKVFQESLRLAAPRTFNLEILSRGLDELADCAADRWREEMLAVLRRLVPEYQVGESSPGAERATAS